MFTFLKNIFFKKKSSDFFFIHIPKTAGTSFINILDACVNENEIFPCQLWNEINQSIVNNKSQYKLIRGHFGGGSYKLLSSENPHRLTILRHPQSLSISTFHFIKREKNTAVHELVNENEMDLKAFLEEAQTAHKINNRMVRHLSFDLGQDPEAQELFLSSQSIKVVNNWIKTPKTIDNSKRLLRAKKALDDCSWFGIQEKFDESMQLFAYTFKRPPIGKSPLLNAHISKEIIEDYCKDLINKQNKYDLQLYDYAQIKFDQNYQSMLNNLQKLPNAISKTTDELIDIHYQQHRNCITDSVEFDFGDDFLGSGWHRRELTQPENTFFRWTSNHHAFIDFWLEADNYILTIRIINSVSSEHLNNLDLQINNTSIPYEYDQNEGVVRIISTTIQRSYIKNNLLRIQFKHPVSLQHKQVFNGNDNRYLGIAINWIKLKPC